jgi:hypothetical protein
MDFIKDDRIKTLNSASVEMYLVRNPAAFTHVPQLLYSASCGECGVISCHYYNPRFCTVKELLISVFCCLRLFSQMNK